VLGQRLERRTRVVRSERGTKGEPKRGRGTSRSSSACSAGTTTPS
jgi:hypothetical protein